MIAESWPAVTTCETSAIDGGPDGRAGRRTGGRTQLQHFDLRRTHDRRRYTVKQFQITTVNRRRWYAGGGSCGHRRASALARGVDGDHSGVKALSIGLPPDSSDGECDSLDRHIYGRRVGARPDSTSDQRGSRHPIHDRAHRGLRCPQSTGPRSSLETAALAASLKRDRRHVHVRAVTVATARRIHARRLAKSRLRPSSRRKRRPGHARLEREDAARSVSGVSTDEEAHQSSSAMAQAAARLVQVVSDMTQTLVDLGR